jgi:hypothetical protein
MEVSSWRTGCLNRSGSHTEYREIQTNFFMCMACGRYTKCKNSGTDPRLVTNLMCTSYGKQVGSYSDTNGCTPTTPVPVVGTDDDGSPTCEESCSATMKMLTLSRPFHGILWGSKLE